MEVIPGSNAYTLAWIMGIIPDTGQFAYLPLYVQKQWVVYESQMKQWAITGDTLVLPNQEKP